MSGRMEAGTWPTVKEKFGDDSEYVEVVRCDNTWHESADPCPACFRPEGKSNPDPADSGYARKENLKEYRDALPQ